MFGNKNPHALLHDSVYMLLMWGERAAESYKKARGEEGRFEDVLGLLFNHAKSDQNGLFADKPDFEHVLHEIGLAAERTKDARTEAERVPRDFDKHARWCQMLNTEDFCESLQKHHDQHVIAMDMLRPHGAPHDPRRYHYRLAAQLTGEGDDNKKARRLLAGRLHDEIAKFVENTCDFMEEHNIESTHNPLKRDKMLWLDSLFFDHLEGIGQQAKESAAKGRQHARERWKSGDVPSIWRLWFDKDNIGPFCRFAPLLAKFLWLDKVKPEIERLERVRKNRPALVMRAHSTLEGAALRRGRTVEEHRDQLKLWSQDHTLLAQTPLLPDQRLINILKAGSKDLQSITAIRLLIYLIRATCTRHYSGEQQPRNHRFEGGISALKNAIGESSSNADNKLLRILDAGWRWNIEWPGGTSKGLWTYSYNDKTGPGKQAELEITVGTPLAPLYVETVPKRDKVLVPIVEMAPALAPGPITYGAQAAFQQAVVRAIVERRREIYHKGMAHLPMAELWRIAQPLGLTKNTMGKAIDVWKSQGPDGPIFLEEVERDHYHLADNERYGPERAFIDQTAKRWKTQSDRGKAGDESRKAKK